jgi:hypothetical protein
MNALRSVGTILLGFGVVLIILGASASKSLADNLSSTFLGHMTQATMWYLYGGIASAVAGLLLVLGSYRFTKA